jgi:hypothetical protein
MAKDLDRCSSCAIAAGVQLTNKLFKKIAPQEAKSLYKKFEDSRISPKKYFSEVRRIIKEFGTIKDLKAFDAIQKMIREEG